MVIINIQLFEETGGFIWQRKCGREKSTYAPGDRLLKHNVILIIIRSFNLN